MIDFIVIMGASKPNRLMPLYLEQLQKAGIPHEAETISMGSPNDGTLERCLRDWRRLANRFSGYDRLILTDAWDVLCYASREEIGEVLACFSPSPVFAGEKNCYPETSLASSIPDRGPWRFVNGGMLTASPSELMKWCHAVESHPAYDPKMVGQKWLNRRLAEKSSLVDIDFCCALFQCMYLDEGEVTARDGRPYNSVTETFPCWVHFNGSWPYEPFFEKMEMSRP